MTMRPLTAFLIGLVFAAHLAPAQEPEPPVTLQIKLLEGDGAVHRPGSKSSTPLTVQVTDAVGRPVPDVTVSFLMPPDGPAGVFASGLSTEVLVTGADGRASVYGVRWGQATGPVRVRITARKGHARAGTFSNQYIEEIEAAAETPAGKKPKSVSKPRGKWLTVVMIAAGAAAGGLALGVAGGGSGTGPSAPPAAGGIQNPPTAPPTVGVGTPSISIGAP